MPERKKASADSIIKMPTEVLQMTHKRRKRCGKMEASKAFYEPPPYLIKTSAEIIKEARLEMSTRLVETKRPFTPRVKDRRLFGPNKNGTSRPPSSFSLRQVEFQDPDSVRLPPILSPPSAQHKQSWHLRTTSLTNLPEDVEAESAFPDGPRCNILRQTHSSPQERTSKDLEPLPKVKYGFSHSSKPGNNFRQFHKRDVHSSHLYGYLRQSGKAGAARVGSISETEEEHNQKEQQEPDILTLEPEKKELKQPTQKNKNQTKSRPKNQGNKEIILNATSLEENKQNDSSKKEVQQILSTIEDLYDQDKYEEQVIPLLEKLYLKLKSEESFRRSNKLSSQVIKTLYRFVENGSDTLLLHIAQVILPLRLSGQNLTAINKLIFKISRSDQNDSLFLNSDILELFVEALGWASPLEDAEACIYGYGALKFLTMNAQIVKMVSKLGLIELITLHMKIVNNARLELLPIPEQTSHAMFQLTGTIRNIAGDETTLHRFIKTGLIIQLCTAMELFSVDLDLVSNIARTMSIISTHDNCCDVIVKQDKSFHSMIKIFSKYPGRQDIIVRLGYALGNIIAKNEQSRLKLYREPGGMTAILNLLAVYLDKDLEMLKSNNSLSSFDSQLSESSQNGSDGSVEDVIVKMIRIVANMSLDKEVGISMTCLSLDQETYYPVDQCNSRDGGRFLDMLLMVLRRKSIIESEELVMSALTTLNNMSFYAEPNLATDGPFASRQIDITQVLSTLLLTNNEESMVEVTRVLGNLTRSKDVRDYILEIGGISQLVRCLDYANRELLYTTAGVLVNLMADWDKRLAFKENNGIQRLIVVLGRDGEKDWRLASLVCQALWNFCIDSTHLYAALGVQSTNHLLTVLVDLIDEERLWGVAEGSSIPESLTESQDYRNWEQFATVATNLLEKIEEYLDSLQAFTQI